MSKGEWRRDRLTGLPVALVARCDERHLDDAGRIDVSSWSDCDLFDIRSIAAVAGYADWRYFETVVLEGTDQPFHVHRIPLYSIDGDWLATFIATHTNSAQAGRAALDETKSMQARAAVLTQVSSVSSGCNLLDTSN